MAKEWNYGNAYEKYDMSGEIKVGTGTLMVHDIFKKLPDFMKQADVVFCDPPGGGSCLSSYYTKAGIEKNVRPFSRYSEFEGRLFEVIKEISPKIVIMELFNTIKKNFEQHLHDSYKNVKIFNSTYYHNPKNVCYIAVASNEPIPEILNGLEGIDEANAIDYICKNLEYNCIADPCMGQGLVAYYSNKYGKKFVGTELNPKRLAVCVDRVTTGILKGV